MVNWGHSLHFTMRVCMYIISITALNMSLTALTRIILKILRYPPFYGDSNYEIFRSIRNASFDFPDPEWTSISDLAKDFIINLLQKDPTKRMTAKAAMKHEWIVGKLSKTRITHNTRRSITYKSREGTKKLRKAVVAFIGSRLTKAEISQIGKVFESIDKDGNGELTLNEINEALSSGKSISAQSCFSSLDSESRHVSRITTG